jgi:hypothetical protein
MSNPPYQYFHQPLVLDFLESSVSEQPLIERKLMRLPEIFDFNKNLLISLSFNFRKQDLKKG